MQEGELDNDDKGERRPPDGTSVIDELLIRHYIDCIFIIFQLFSDLVQ